jgi:hypothetical protein
VLVFLAILQRHAAALGPFNSGSIKQQSEGYVLKQMTLLRIKRVMPCAALTMRGRRWSQECFHKILVFNFCSDWCLNELVLICRGIRRRSPCLRKKFGNLVAIFFAPPAAKLIFLSDKSFCLILAEKCSARLHVSDLAAFQKRLREMMSRDAKVWTITLVFKSRDVLLQRYS